MQGSRQITTTPEWQLSQRIWPRGIWATVVAVTTAGVCLAPSAAADTVDSLRSGLMSVRATACAPFHFNPIVEQAAKGINDSSDKWISFASRTAPETDALPLLKDLGYGGTKAVILSGASADESASIKGVLLQGYSKIPDCSYTDYGVSAIFNETKDMYLTTIVLAA